MENEYTIISICDNREYTISGAILSLPMYNSTTTCIIYSRQSTPTQKSLDDQTAECLFKAKELGFKYAVIIKDKGSGYRERKTNLPGMELIVKITKKYKFTELFVYDSSRFSRNVGKTIDNLKHLKVRPFTLHSELCLLYTSDAADE